MIPTRPRFFLIAWMIWSGFLAGLALQLLSVLLWQDALAAILKTDAPILWLRTLGYVIAIILFPIIGGIRRRMDRRPVINPSGSETSTEESHFPGTYLTGLVLLLALAESIGIFGFILFLCGDDLTTFYIFIGLAALAMLLHRPRIEYPG